MSTVYIWWWAKCLQSCLPAGFLRMPALALGNNNRDIERRRSRCQVLHSSGPFLTSMHSSVHEGKPILGSSWHSKVKLRFQIQYLIMMKQIQCHTYRNVIHSGRNHFNVVTVALCTGFQVILICHALGLAVPAHRRRLVHGVPSCCHCHLVHGVPGCHCSLPARCHRGLVDHAGLHHHYCWHQHQLLRCPWFVK